MSLTPPSDSPEPFTLKVAEAPVKFEKNTVQDMLPSIPDEAEDEITTNARKYVDSLTSLKASSPEFAQKVREIAHYGETDIRKSADAPNRLLSENFTSTAGAKKTGNAASVKVATTLGQLRSIVDDLAPGVKETGIARFLPGGKKVQKYLQRYESAQEQLDAIVRSLLHGQDELRRDNASLQQEEKNLWEVMGHLNEHIVYTEKVATELKKQIQAEKDAGNDTQARTMEADLLFTVNQRRQDLVTQLAVSAQGYATMGMIRTNNLELIKGVDRARSSTVVALRTGMLNTHALHHQEMVVQSINALNDTTNRVLSENGDNMRKTTAKIHAQATNSGVSVETISKVFSDLQATLVEIENFKVESNAKFDTTINALTNELQQVRPAIDRVHAITSRDPGGGAQAIER